MQQTERAVADFSRVIEGNPEVAAAWLERGHAYLLGRQWDRAVRDLSRAIDLDARDARAWHQRGYARAALGQWERAAADLAEAVDLPGDPSEALAHQALVCLRLHDAEGYRKVCKALLQRPRALMDYPAIAQAAWTCAVGPDAGVKPLWESHLSEMAAKPYPFHRAAAAAYYRAGDLESAIRKGHEALSEARRSGQEAAPTVWLILGMAEHRLARDPARAREWLDKARTWVAVARKPTAEAPASDEPTWERLPWPERLALELLLDEAEKLIQGEKPAEKGP
jgi:tetratricopeptide (TPR) repeat protein